MAESYPMTGGDGVYSYTKNSSIQKEILSDVKEMIHDAITENLDVKSLVSVSKTLRVADLGCSVGPNTFYAMQYVLDAVEIKCQSEGVVSHDLEFQVFFNDHVSNDFNTLFTSLPSDKPYYAAGVPGSFYDRLFPKSSLHFFHSSFALHWPSKLPEELQDKKSSAWNKGKIHYGNSSDEVANAYAGQFAKDIGRFLNARANELVAGGMVVMTLLGLPDGAHRSDNLVNVVINYYGSILIDMVKSGLITDDQVDSFNFPIYCPYVKEMREAVERNGSFSVIQMEISTLPSSEAVSKETLERLLMHNRSTHEGVIAKHFGDEIAAEMFNRAFERLELDSELARSMDKIHSLCVVLKRK